MASPTALTPQERLAISRKAIVRHMNRHHRSTDDQIDDVNDEADEPVLASQSGPFARVRYAASVWWQRHPASAAFELANPLLRNYARTHPFKLVGISTAAGAAIAVIRPWRMISASALVVAAVKASGLSNTLMSVVSSMIHPSGKTDNIS